MESLARAWYVDELGELGKGREEDRMGEREGGGWVGQVGVCIAGRGGIRREQPGSSVWQ